MNSFLLSAGELRNRGGVKWRRHPADVIPAFVADMDFRVAAAVQAAVERFSAAQDYGYGEMGDAERLYKAFAAWMHRRHGWSPDPALTLAVADVVQGIVATLVAYTAPGDGVIVQTPAYPPFLMSVANTGRTLVENPLRDGSARFELDLDGLGKAARQARLLLLCSPHNPTGRVFGADELEAIASIAEENDLVIVADEIHADLVYPGATHTPMESIPGAAIRTVTLTSATKGFNIAGLRAAVVHFGGEELKARFDRAVPAHLLGSPNRIGIAATIAAWEQGESWLAEVMAYLAENRALVADWAGRAGLAHHAPEATYLAWLGCRHLELPEDMTPHRLLLDEGRVGLSDGADFGAPGRGFVRLNFATSREILDEILDRMTGALRS